MSAMSGLKQGPLWTCDLRTGIEQRYESMNPAFANVAPNTSALAAMNGSTGPLSASRSSLSVPGIPSLTDIPISRELAANHPLRSYITQDAPLTAGQLREILRHPDIDLSITGFQSGSVPAAVNSRFMNGEVLPVHDYSRNEWLRDAVITAVACHRAGFTEHAYKIVGRAWQFLGSPEHRSLITSFHFGTDEDAYNRFIHTDHTPHIKYAVDPDGGLRFCEHDWGHQQIDALSAAVWGPYRFANERVKGIGEFAMREYLGRAYDLRELDPIPGATDSILPSVLKFMNRIQIWKTFDYGPWEDFKAQSRATGVGIASASAFEAIDFHNREGWEYLPVAYGGGNNGVQFRSEVRRIAERSQEVLWQKIPHTGYASECDRRPHDSALVLLLHPFDPRLSLEQQHTILRTVYLNMGEAGFRRWQMDHERGPDGYVGQDYHLNMDPSAKGEFANNRVEGYRPAEWTLFDPLLAAYYFRRFINSGGADTAAYLYGDRHFKRALSMITKEEEHLTVAGKHASYGIPKGILPEARFWDSRSGCWRSNHNSPLLMAHAALGMAIPRAVEASRLMQYVQEFPLSF